MPKYDVLKTIFGNSWDKDGRGNPVRQVQRTDPGGQIEVSEAMAAKMNSHHPEDDPCLVPAGSEAKSKPPSRPGRKSESGKE